LLHLSAQIDRGIKKKLKEKETPEAQKWRKISTTLHPIR